MYDSSCAQHALINHGCAEQIDNALYTFGLSEVLKKQVENDGRVEMRDGERENLIRTKELYIVMVAVLVNGTVIMGGNMDPAWWVGIFIFTDRGLFLVAGWVECVMLPDQTPGQVAKAMAETFVACFLGFVAHTFMFLWIWTA
jgi:hypothetical protein